MEALDLFKANKTFKRILLQTPRSQRHIPTDMTALDEQLEVNPNKQIFEGTDYIKQYVEEEEVKVLEAAREAQKQYPDKRFDQVSQGTMPALNELQLEELIKIYKTYNFAYRPKENLTISNMKDKIVSMIDTNPVVVIQGPTGCGKTTQVPQFLLDNSYRKKEHCNIIVTQPRRIAAISIAQRVSKERNWPLGTLVGYQVGMCNITSNDTRLTYCTTGVLLRKLIRSKNMLDYTHVILDEVHERNQEMDFLLLVVRKLLRTNSRQVKVVLMSATFDVDKFATYFSSPVGNKLVPAPIIDVAKRNRFNVNIFYLCQMGILCQLPEVSEKEARVSVDMMNFCLKIIIILDDVDKKSDEEDTRLENDDEEDEDDEEDFKRHVILIFLPGIWEIEEMHDILKAPVYEKMKWDVVVMHSSITSEEQQRIFQKPEKGYRRIILSTNISESSITVPDVKYVIDFCLSKQLVTNPKTNFQSLELVWASKANCEQRAGRTGRVMDGRVYRLIPKQFYEHVLPKEGDPEMLRAPLENLVLNAKILDMGDPKSLLALSLDPPDLSNLKRTILLLKEAGALFNKMEDFSEYDGQLTDLGRIMANLPMDIRISKLIALGHVFSVLKDSIIIGASMAVKSIFSNPFQKKLQAYNTKLSWADRTCSDCIASLNAFKVWQQEKASRRITNSQMEKSWAHRHFIQIRMLREIDHYAKEVTQRLENLGIVDSIGENRVVWSEAERAFVQKIVIAGAFYPNYFVKSSRNRLMDEKDAVKLVSGLDPAKTVYLQGWPTNQPGPLYAKRIQEIFKECSPSSVGRIIVSFDQSSRVYVHFWNSERALLTKEDRAPDIMGKVSLAVYRALKMRKINTPIQVQVLDEKIANAEAQKLNLISDSSKTFFDEKPKIFEQKTSFGLKPVLPSFDSTIIPLVITEIINPGHFWAQMEDLDAKKKLTDILKKVNEREDLLLPVTSISGVGTCVFAPIVGKNTYHRAMIQSYSQNNNIKLAQVLFADTGKTAVVKLSDLRQLRSFAKEEVHLINLFNLPAQAFECVLTNIRPTFMSNITGQWSPEAHKEFCKVIKFDEHGKRRNLFGKVYSVVNSVVSLTLIGMSGNTNNKKEFNVNEHLIKCRYAEHKEEDYLSRTNHDLRLHREEMCTQQIKFYENAQYDQYYLSDLYPEPPEIKACHKNVTLRGPFSPLEIDLMHLTSAGAAKKINIEGHSVNSVLLDTSPEDPHDRLLVAGSVNEAATGDFLTLRDTTLMPNLPGLTALLALIFAPRIELRRNSTGSYYTGALCGLGALPGKKEALFPEHDMEIKFDVEITIDDLLTVNKVRHWISTGLRKHDGKSDPMTETINCQKRVKKLFFTLVDKQRIDQDPEIIPRFSKWNLYSENDFLQPGKFASGNEYVYPLHHALELSERNEEFERMLIHISELRELARTDIRNRRFVETTCELCKEDIFGIFELRDHLFSLHHRKAQEKLGIK